MAQQFRLRIASPDEVPPAYVDWFQNQIVGLISVHQLPDPGQGGGSGQLGTVLNADGLTFTDFDAVDNGDGTYTDPFAIDNGDGTMTMGS